MYIITKGKIYIYIIYIYKRYIIYILKRGRYIYLKKEITGYGGLCDPLAVEQLDTILKNTYESSLKRQRFPSTSHIHALAKGTNTLKQGKQTKSETLI